MVKEATCSALGARLFLEHAAVRGLDRAALLTKAGLDEAMLADDESCVPLESCYALVEEAATALDDRYFGHSAALALRDDSLGAFGFLGMTSETLGEGLATMIEHSSAFSASERYELVVEGERAYVRYLPYGAPRPAHTHLAEFFLSDLCQHLPATVEGGIDGVAAAIRGPEERARHLARALETPVEPDHAVDELSFDARSLDRRMRRADPALFGFFEGHLAKCAPRPSPTVSGRVRDLIDRRLATGEFDASSVARALHVSPRTLQRRLHAEGVTLSALVVERRLCRARTLLAGGMSMSEVAYAVGYSEASALHRALRRTRGRRTEKASG